VRCPYCGARDTRVLDSRSSEDGDAIRRRRECAACRRRFTTFERAERVVIHVIKRDGRREAFDRDKILIGMLRACEGRPVSRATLEDVAEEIARSILETGATTIRSGEIGDRVIERLRRLDDVAYVRFASVYRRVGDVDRLVEEIEALKARKQLEAELQSQVLLIPLAPKNPDQN
jgi:transcriptional repressor NrdR